MIRHRATAFHPFTGMDVPALVAMRARQRPDHPFLVWEPFEGKGEVLTYASFHDLVGRLAAGLAARGVRRGDHLLVHLDNCLEILLAFRTRPASVRPRGRRSCARREPGSGR